jgi:hypothetical protein
MSFFNYRWDKCCVLAIGGTYVYLTEGGTNVGGRKVAASVLPPPHPIIRN